MHVLARATDPRRDEHDDTQIVIDGRMAESERSFESEEHACASLLDHTSKGTGPNSSIRLVDSADWAEEFPSERGREDATTEQPSLARDHSTQHASFGATARLTRLAHASFAKFSARLMHGEETAWNAVVHASTRFSFSVAPPVATIPAGGQTAENMNAARGEQLLRFVAWLTVPSFCGGVAVGGITVSLLSGVLPRHSPFEAATQAETGSSSTLEEPAVSVPPLPPLMKTPVVADVVPTAEPPRTRVEASTRKRDAKTLNGSVAAARKSGTAAARQAQSVVFRGSLAVNSEPPGAQVFVNGEPAGVTPLTLARLPAGSRAVRIEFEGYETWSTSVRVVANQRTRVTGNLTPRR